MPTESAGQIARQLKIPILGIGAGSSVDGQLVIMHDIMGFYQSFRPWFAKSYVPDVVNKFTDYLKSVPDLRKHGREERRDGLLVLAEMAISAYIEEVQNGQFPGEEYSYPIEIADLDKLKKSSHWK
jgi:3-methyl-2-oxobutanoate hydroxymethyltransferase